MGRLEGAFPISGIRQGRFSMIVKDRAEHMGDCRHCGSPINQGDPVARIRRAYPWIHAECALALQAMRRAGVDRRAELARLRAS